MLNSIKITPGCNAGWRFHRKSKVISTGLSEGVSIEMHLKPAISMVIYLIEISRAVGSPSTLKLINRD